MQNIDPNWIAAPSSISAFSVQAEFQYELLVRAELRTELLHADFQYELLLLAELRTELLLRAELLTELLLLRRRRADAVELRMKQC